MSDDLLRPPTSGKSVNGENAQPHGGQKPCRSCVDFKTWMKDSRKAVSNSSKDSQQSTSSTESAPSSDTPPHNCPLDINELGRNTWSFLHTMAANYPDKPTPDDQSRMKSFISSFSYLYPCEMCAYDFRRRIAKEPVQAESQEAVSQWLCRMHNQINRMLGKNEFDCRLVNERWRDGWDDGSCG